MSEEDLRAEPMEEDAENISVGMAGLDVGYEKRDMLNYIRTKANDIYLYALLIEEFHIESDTPIIEQTDFTLRPISHAYESIFYDHIAKVDLEENSTTLRVTIPVLGQRSFVIIFKGSGHKHPYKLVWCHHPPSVNIAKQIVQAKSLKRDEVIPYAEKLQLQFIIRKFRCDKVKKMKVLMAKNNIRVVHDPCCMSLEFTFYVTTKTEDGPVYHVRAELKYRAMNILAYKVAILPLRDDMTHKQIRTILQKLALYKDVETDHYYDAMFSTKQPFKWL